MQSIHRISIIIFLPLVLAAFSAQASTPDKVTNPDNSTPDIPIIEQPGSGSTSGFRSASVYQGAVFSYSNDIATAIPLEGAILEPQTVYIFWQGTDITAVNYYCCKGLSDSAIGEGHNTAMRANNYPFGMAIDASRFTTAGSRELYVDYRTADGNIHKDNFTTFSVKTEPTPDPDFQGAVFSYSNDIATAIPLEGAILEPQTVYIFWQGTDITAVNYYCCKGLSDSAIGEGHNAAMRANSYPFGMAIDASQFTTAGSRELYVDYRTADGNIHKDNFTTFSVKTEPTPDPDFQGAVFSYSNDIATAIPLEGAILEPQTVYIFWQGTDITAVNYYCCKGLSDSAIGEGHNAAMRANSYPFGMAIDASRFTTDGSRELYVDYRTADGNMHKDNFTTFSVNITNPTLIPVNKDVTVSWNIPDAREDGSDLEVHEIDGYVIYIASGNTPVEEGFPTNIIDAQTTDYTFPNLQAGNYKIAISTYDSKGIYSQNSKTVTFTVQ